MAASDLLPGPDEGWVEHAEDEPFFSPLTELRTAGCIEGKIDKAARVIQYQRGTNAGNQVNPPSFFSACPRDDLAPFSEANDFACSGLQFRARFEGEYAGFGAIVRKEGGAALTGFESSAHAWVRKTNGCVYREGDMKTSTQKGTHINSPATVTCALTYPWQHRSDFDPDGDDPRLGRLVVTVDGMDEELVVAEDLPVGCVPFVTVYYSGAEVEILSFATRPIGGAFTKSARKN
jgi:hypothetical protein